MRGHQNDGLGIDGRSLFLTQHHKPPCIRMILIPLSPRLQYHPVSRRDDLGIHHARLGAAQAGVGPIDRFHRDQLNLVNRHAQPLSQVFSGQPHHLLRPRRRRYLCSSRRRRWSRAGRRWLRRADSWRWQRPFHPARLCAARLRRGRYRLRCSGRRLSAATGAPQAYQEEQHPRYQPMIFHACSPRSYSSSSFIIQTLPPSEKFPPS
jgi:hypothetical protein